MKFFRLDRKRAFDGLVNGWLLLEANRLCVRRTHLRIVQTGGAIGEFGLKIIYCGESGFVSAGTRFTG